MVLRAQSLGDQLVVAATCSQSPIVEKKKNSMWSLGSHQFFQNYKKTII